MRALTGLPGRSATTVREAGHPALFGAAAVLLGEQLLAAGGRQHGRLVRDQAKVAAQPHGLLAPLARGPQGVVGELCMGGHMRILDLGLDP